MYQIKYKKKALKALLKMPREISSKFRQAFEAIANDQSSDYDIKALQGTEGYRLRIGTYRAVYEIDNGLLIVTVFNIGSRGDIYK